MMTPRFGYMCPRCGFRGTQPIADLIYRGQMQHASDPLPASTVGICYQCDPDEEPPGHLHFVEHASVIEGQEQVDWRNDDR